MNDRKKPALLLPAGSPESFDAALAAGADEIYLGGKSFNARLGAENFSDEQIFDAIKKAHFFGVKVFVTLNTLLLDREMNEALRFAESLYLNDVDAIISTDPGFSAALHARYPDLSLHASTQCSAHNSEGVKLLASRGFDRVVLARECSCENIKKIRAAAPDTELEIFVHGALCVCHSGMCEFSAYMGGRSGNRGECAQPCRLPDENGVCRFSLKDNCLASHIEEIIASGVDSLKVEGRMKSPEYVYGVGRTYRTLLDEGRSASPDEFEYLSGLFSRSGFTDGYFKGSTGADMLGVRTDSDKAKTKTAEAETAVAMRSNRRRLPVSVAADIRAATVSSLTLSTKNESVTVYGEVPQPAITSPLSESDVVKNLCKFGNTPFSVDVSSFSLYLDRGISLPISAINSLRRTAVERLEASINTVFYPGRQRTSYIEPAKPAQRDPDGCSSVAHFVRAKGMPARRCLGGFSHIFLPIDEYLDAPTHIRDAVDGVELPPVVMQNEYSLLEEMLIRAKLCGIKHVSVQNIGQLRTAQRYGFQIHGGIFMSVYNSKSAEVLAKEGFTTLMLSPELNVVQMKAAAASSPVKTGAAVYGRLPMTVLEKCFIRDLVGVTKPAGKCEACGDGEFRYYRDRTGEAVPIHREFIHRNITYNPCPIYMADKLEPVSGGAVGDLHFFFTDETAEEAAAVTEAYKNKTPAERKIRRM